MKLIVKPSSLKYIKEEKKKAYAFLFGIKNLSINKMFTLTVKQLDNIIKKENIKVFISLDKNIFNKDISYLKKVLLELDKLNVCGIMFYDLSILYLAKSLNIKTPLVWNQNFFVTNYETINYYKSKNVSSVYLSSEITYDEIEEITKNINSKTFINGFGYQLMSYSKRKFITNYFKYNKKFNINKIHYLEENNHKYIIKEEKEGTAILSCYILNSINYLNKFKIIGIDYLVLDESFIDHDKFLEVVDIYSDFLNKKDIENDQKIEKLFPGIEVSEGFLNKKTIYRVKKEKRNEKN